jgi:hypothetical protein
MIPSQGRADFAGDALRRAEEYLRAEFGRDLEDGTSLQKFRDRDALKNFVGEYAGGVSSERFRDLNYCADA